MEKKIIINLSKKRSWIPLEFPLERTRVRIPEPEKGVGRWKFLKKIPIIRDMKPNYKWGYAYYSIGIEPLKDKFSPGVMIREENKLFGLMTPFTGKKLLGKHTYIKLAQPEFEYRIYLNAARIEGYAGNQNRVKLACKVVETPVTGCQPRESIYTFQIEIVKE